MRDGLTMTSLKTQLAMEQKQKDEQLSQFTPIYQGGPSILFVSLAQH
jgi:hypothetical protein